MNTIKTMSMVLSAMSSVKLPNNLELTSVSVEPTGEISVKFRTSFTEAKIPFVSGSKLLSKSSLVKKAKDEDILVLSDEDDESEDDIDLEVSEDEDDEGLVVLDEDEVSDTPAAQKKEMPKRKVAPKKNSLYTQGVPKLSRVGS